MWLAVLGRPGADFEDFLYDNHVVDGRPGPSVDFPGRSNGECGGNRTRVRKSSAVRPTYLAWSFGSRLAPADRQAGARPVASTDARGQATRPRTGADENDAAPSHRGPSPSAS